MPGQDLVFSVLTRPLPRVGVRDRYYNVNKTSASGKLSDEDKKHLKTKVKSHGEPSDTNNEPEKKGEGDIDLFV